MKYAEQKNIIDRIVTLAESGESDCETKTRQLPVNNYVDDGVFEKEQSLFCNQPLIVGRIDEIPNSGDFITHNETQTPIVVIRQSDGSAKAFMNVCRHRGTRLLNEKSGNTRALVCPYHAWSYKTDGKLRGIPHEYGFRDVDKSCLNLVELALEERFGFIWVLPEKEGNLCLDDFFSAQVTEDFISYGLSDHVVYDPKYFVRPINWKLAIDTFLENYHVRKTHRESIDRFFIDNVGLYEPFGKHIRNVYPKKTILNMEGAASYDIRQHANVLYFIFPNTLLLIEPDHVNVSIVYPRTINETALVNYTLLEKYPSTDKAIEYFDKNNRILYAALEEDFAMATSVQKSLKSGANEYFNIGRFEKGIQYFHDTVEKWAR